MQREDELYMIEAAIFDMDGVIIDSEGFYEESVDIIMGRFGIEVPQEIKLTLHGMPSEDTWIVLADRFSPPASAQELLAMEQEFIDERIDKGQMLPFPFVMDFIRSLRESGIKVAVATNNYRYRAAKIVEQLGAETLVDVLVCWEDVPNHKPAPDMFLLAADSMGAGPENCIVFEDAPYGIEAARAAGMIAALHAPPTGDHFGDLGADMVFNTFENLTLESVKRALKEREQS
jgi:HAD superfamily hydrolase (TIGR01509 family)